MSAELIVLFLLYPLFGVFTICTLAKYRMRVATVLYTIAFFVLFLFLPTFTGRNLMLEAATDDAFSWSLSSVGRVAWSSVETATNYLSWSFFVAILISLFLCLSAVSVALTAIRIVRSIRQRKGPYRMIGVRRASRVARPPRKVYSKPKFCHTFCRYNC